MALLAICDFNFVIMTCDFDPLRHVSLEDMVEERSYPGKLTKKQELSITVYLELVELFRMLLEYYARAGECFTLQ